MVSPLCDAIHLTEVETRDTPLECDTFIPPVDSSQYRAWSASFPRNENGMRYSFVTYVRTRTQGGPSPAETTPPEEREQAAVAPSGVFREASKTGAEEPGAGESLNGRTRPDGSVVQRLPRLVKKKHEEYQYLKLIEEIIRDGVHKGDRTGTGTISTFGCSMRFNLRKSFPLLTTKRVFWRGVVEELLWFVAGSTNAKLLQEKGVHIWDGNGSRQYLDSIGLKDREEHDLGPVYGFQWRHFGAKYTDMHGDYTGKGFDQLADLIHRIKTKPEDRRLILSAWNPADLKLVALPPCHMFCQFYVADGELSCQMYQRSCDMGLGVPFNIASYSLLTVMIAQVCGLQPGDFVHVLGDAHVYANHVEPLREQLRNTPRPFPTLRVNPAVTDIDSFKADDFELVGYEPHKKIAMKMAV